MTKADVVRPYVEKTVKEILNVEELIVAPDGTIPIRSGSAGVYVRILDAGERAIVHVYSPLVRQVPKTPQLLEKLNEMNANTTFARTFWANDEVVVTVDLLADSLDKEELRGAIDLASGFADYWDTELSATFGGKVAFDERPSQHATEGPSLPPPPGADLPHTEAAGGEKDDGPAHGYL